MSAARKHDGPFRVELDIRIRACNKHLAGAAMVRLLGTPSINHLGRLMPICFCSNTKAGLRWGGWRDGGDIHYEHAKQSSKMSSLHDLNGRNSSPQLI